MRLTRVLALTASLGTVALVLAGLGTVFSIGRPVVAQAQDLQSGALPAPLFQADADLSITKSDSPDPVIAGSTLIYNLQVANNGISNTTSVLVTDTLPAGVSFVTSVPPCLEANGVVTCDLGSMISGASADVTITAVVNSSVLGTITNTAVVGGDVIDPTPANNSASVTTNVIAQADLALGKVGSADPVIAGTPLTYTLTVDNIGPSDAESVQVVDTLPGAVTFAGADPGCAHNAGVVTCAQPSLAAGGNAQFAIVVDVNSGATGSLTNSAEVSAATTDPNGDNDTTGLDTAVNPQADLALEKADSVDPATAGGSLIYSLTVTNNGPSDAENVVVTDTLPASVTYGSDDSSCSHALGIVTCSVGTLAGGASQEIAITVGIAPDATGVMTNNAEVTSATSDPNAANDIAFEDTTVGSAADLVLSKVDGPDPAIAGDSLVYTLTVTNSGPSSAEDVQVVDNLPADVIYQSDNAGCTENAGVVTCALGLIGAGGESTVAITTGVAPGAAGTITNTAGVSADTPDPNTENNAATAETTINAEADLSLSKVGTPDPVPAGASLTYALTVTNTGPSDATGVQVVDTLPPGLIFQSATAGCAHSAGAVTCALGTVAAGVVTPVTITALVDTDAPGSLENAAEVSADTPDPNTADNNAAATTTVVQEADLSLDKEGTPDALTAGELVTYTLIVANNGPSNASGVVVADTLPAEVTLVSVTPDAPTCSFQTGVVICDFPSINAGLSQPITIVADVMGATPLGTFTNTATVTSTTVEDPNSGNNVDFAETEVADQIVDLVLDKTASSDTVEATGTLTYTLAVTNLGPSAATDVVLTDTLPAGVTFQSDDAGCTHAAGAVTCTLDTIPPDQSAEPIQIVVSVNPDTIGPITNRAGVTSAVADAEEDDNFTDLTTNVTAVADLSLAKDASPPAIDFNGGPITYTLTAENAGPAFAHDVSLTDTLPSDLNFLNYLSDVGSCSESGGVVVCNLGDLAPAQAGEVQLLVSAPQGLTGTLTNEAVVASLSTDPDSANNTAEVSSTVLPDDVPPTINWLNPKTVNKVSGACEAPVLLAVVASDNFGVDEVVFRRWDYENEIWILLLRDDTAPYQTTLDPAELLPSFNEIRATAIDLVGRTASESIFLQKVCRTHFPLVSR